MTEQATATELPDTATQKIINELNEIVILNDTAVNNESASTDAPKRAIDDDTTTELRERATSQRQRGIDEINKRHAGVVSVIKTVTINERVVGSAFVRFFPAIERGLAFINDRGDIFMGKNEAALIKESILAQFKNLDDKVTAQLKDLDLQLKVHSANEDFMTPQYSAPASEHDVQVRTRTALDLINIIAKQDKVVTALQVLAWNGQVENATIDAQEWEIKKDLRGLSMFIGRSLRGMQKKGPVAPKAKKAPKKPTATTPAPVVIVTEEAVA